MSSRAGERGFTLLEVLVAFAIAALALTVLFRATGSGLGSARAASRYEEAVVRARSHLAAIGHDAALVAGDASGDDGGGFQWRLSVRPLASLAPPPPEAAAPDATSSDTTPSGATSSGAAAAAASPDTGAGGTSPRAARAAAPPPVVTLFAVEVAIGWTADGRKRQVVLRSERLGAVAANHG